MHDALPTAPSLNVCVVCHYFAPEIGAPQARLLEMTTEWVAQGHRVQVVTGFPNHPTGVIHPGYEGRRRMTESVNGVEVLRTWLYATRNEGIVKKTVGHLSFMASSLLLGWRKVRRPDVVVVSSPTFFSIFSAWVLARRFRVPLVVEVRDLWPGIFVELGVLTNRQIIWLLERLELAAYRAAAAVVVVSDGFKDDLVGRGVPAGKVEVITNGVDLDHFLPRSADPAVRRRLGAGPGQPLVVYIGAHGISQGLEIVLDAARALGPKVAVALVGEGARKPALLAAAHDLDQVHFFDGVPRDEVSDILAAADILVVPLRDVPLFETFIPSKMFEFLAVERPVIGAVRGEAADILARAGAVVVPPEDGDALAGAIERLIDDPQGAADRAAVGRAFVTEFYDRRMLARRYADLLASVTSGDDNR